MGRAARPGGRWCGPLIEDRRTGCS